MKELLNLFISFFKIGALTFGGGYAMLPMIEREIVEKHKWATLEEVMDYFAVGQCTPGVIAVNTATFIGYKRKKISGGVIATLGVIAPSLIIICALAGIIDMVSDNVYVKHAFAGISVAVCALLVQAIVKLIKGGIKDLFGLIVAICSLILALLLGLSPIIIVLLSGIAGCIYKAINEKRNTKNTDKKEEHK